jgi:hypothetical protein
LEGRLGEIDANSLVALERLERLRDRSREFVVRPGAKIVAQERDAVGITLDIFDQSSQLRRRTIQDWIPAEGDRLSSFLDGLPGVRTIEDQLIAGDAGAAGARLTVVGAVFAVGERKLEVFNVNRTAVENSLGVDLLYWHEAFDAWTLVQYKSMEKTGDSSSQSAVYRPDASFDAELEPMRAFRAAQPDSMAIHR